MDYLISISITKLTGKWLLSKIMIRCAILLVPSHTKDQIVVLSVEINSAILNLWVHLMTRDCCKRKE
jgi:hypothetical protein